MLIILIKGTRVVAEPHKVAAEWQSEEGTKFLLRRKIVICERGSMKEYYDSKEVTPDVVEGTDALRDWHTFRRTSPDREWAAHNNHVVTNWEKEKAKAAERKAEENNEDFLGNTWWSRMFCGICPCTWRAKGW